MSLLEELTETWHNCQFICPNMSTRILLCPGLRLLHSIDIPRSLNPYKLNHYKVITHVQRLSCTQSVNSLCITFAQFISSTPSLCMDVPVTVAVCSNSVTSLFGWSVHYSQYPTLLAIVSAASSIPPFAHRLY